MTPDCGLRRFLEQIADMDSLMGNHATPSTALPAAQWLALSIMLGLYNSGPIGQGPVGKGSILR